MSGLAVVGRLIRGDRLNVTDAVPPDEFNRH
jgi:hypothetical protein